MTPLLLDTNALVWVGEGRIDKAAEALLNRAYTEQRETFLSPFSAWEIGMLMARGRLRSAMSAEAYFAKALSAPLMSLAPLDPAILIASSYLPGTPPRDPADRILIATARALGLTLMTRDRVILDYAADGHVLAAAC